MVVIAPHPVLVAGASRSVGKHAKMPQKVCRARSPSSCTSVVRERGGGGFLQGGLLGVEGVRATSLRPASGAGGYSCAVPLHCCHRGRWICCSVHDVDEVALPIPSLPYLWLVDETWLKHYMHTFSTREIF